MKLHLKERMLLYLGEQAETRPKFSKEEPLDFTQAGIADRLGLSLERVSTGLRALEKENLVKRKKEYSRKTGRFRNFYFPTADGLVKFEEIRRMLDGELIKIRDLNDGLREMSLREAVNYLKTLAPKPDQPQRIYKLKERRHLKVDYTNILNNISRDVLDVRVFTEPKTFEFNNEAWATVRDAYYDAKNEYVVLTKNRNWQAGAIWLKRGIKSPFTAEFRYKAGGGTGGDGFVFMFYKKKEYWPCDGGNLGFVPGVTPIPGYGIEFDSFPNRDYNDPPYPHVALIKDHSRAHVKHVKEERVKDFKWHNVKILVEESMIAVYLDHEKILEWSGKINRAHSGLGFAASTGGLDNWHIIGEVKITKLAAKNAGGERSKKFPKVEAKK